METTWTIYVITCLITMLRYVGRTTRPLDIRLMEHLASAYSETPNGSRLLEMAIRAHGRAAFKIEALDTAEGVVGAKAAETAWIKRLGTQWPNGMNLMCDGHSELSKARMAAAHTGLHRGSRSGMAKLTEEIVATAKRRLDDGWTLRMVAQMLNVDPSTLSKATRGKTWAHVD